MLYSRVRCAKDGYSYYLKFLAVNENFVDRKQGVRFGVFVMCNLVNFNVFLPNRTPDIDKTVHLVSHRLNFHSPLETLSPKTSRFLHKGRVHKAYEPPRDKTNTVVVRPAKTQISLGIRPV